MFRDRREAGRLLAERLAKYAGRNTLVLAIPRGGVIVAEEVAKKLGANLDLVIPRKIGSPSDPEFAIGAVAPDKSFVVDEKIVRELGVDKEYIERAVKMESAEISRRMMKYRGDTNFPNVEGRDVIVADDGIATGYTMKVVIEFLRKMKPGSLVVAVPVAPAETLEDIREQADDVICLDTPAGFYAIGAHYEEFSQVSDDEVIKIMGKFRKK